MQAHEVVHHQEVLPAGERIRRAARLLVGHGAARSAMASRSRPAADRRRACTRCDIGRSRPDVGIMSCGGVGCASASVAWAITRKASAWWPCRIRSCARKGASRWSGQYRSRSQRASTSRASSSRSSSGSSAATAAAAFACREPAESRPRLFALPPGVRGQSHHLLPFAMVADASDDRAGPARQAEPQVGEPERVVVVRFGVPCPARAGARSARWRFVPV